MTLFLGLSPRPEASRDIRARKLPEVQKIGEIPVLRPKQYFVLVKHIISGMNSDLHGQYDSQVGIS
jgi:hypothetical protein